MNHASQDSISNIISQLDDSTKQIVILAASITGVAAISGKILYDNLSPEQKEKIVSCFRAVRNSAADVISRLSMDTTLTGPMPNDPNNIYNNNQYRNRDIELQIGLESLSQRSSPRLQNALGNSRNEGYPM